MRRLFSNSWFITGLGVLAGMLVLWFVGPLVSISSFTPLATVWSRVVLLVLVVSVWIAVRLMQDRKAKAANREMAQNLGDDDAVVSRTSDEVAALRQQFEEGMEIMRRSRGGRGNLYDLPWYMIIGPPGAGKTTALVNSGLRFPLAERFGKTALRGVGGTRNCDWWFTDEAVLLDTAGRYTTQDSHEAVDRAAWEGFLGLLKKYRKRRPINGVLVAISATDLLTMDVQTRRQHAAAIKQRIQELDESFSIRFPVYLIITKCDLINGFVEYFDDLSLEEREQVWGFTLPIEEPSHEDSSDNVERELNALFDRLSERSFDLIHKERDVKRRGKIYGFPQQIVALKEPLVDLVNDVFTGSRFHRPPFFRGVYFSSGTQEGTPIDRVMVSVASAFGLQTQELASFSGQGRSFFLTRLLRDVVFREAGIAGTNEKSERRRAFLSRGAYAGVIFLTTVMIAAWTVSYFGNREMIQEVDSKTQNAAMLLASVPANRVEPQATLEALNELQGLAFPSEDSFFNSLGLNQSEKLTIQGDGAYRRALVGQLLPRIMLRMEQQVARSDVSLEYTYEALKNYLSLGSEKHYDAEEIGAWVTLDWDLRLKRDIGNESYAQLNNHLLALLNEQPVQLPIPLDRQLIDSARQRLLRISLEKRVYTRLKATGLTDDLGGFNLVDKGGNDILRVFVRESGKSLNTSIPAFFSRAGFERIFENTASLELARELAAEQWVLRDDEMGAAFDLAPMLSNLRDLYFSEYASVYIELLDDIRLAPFSSPREAADMLNILADPNDSPIVRLLTAVASETDFSTKNVVDNKLAEGVDAFAAAKEQLKQQLGDSSDVFSPLGEANRLSLNAVEREFEAYQKLSGDSAGITSQMTSILRDLADFMFVVSSQSNGQGIPQHVAQGGQAVLQQAKLIAERSNVPFLRSVMSSAALGVESIAMGGVARNVDAQWAAGPAEFCQRAIAGRYPISKTAEVDIRIEDFGRFFGYGGIMDQFFDGYLRDKVVTSTKPWRGTARSGVELSPSALRQFELAHSIKETFFRGNDQPSVGFQLAPVRMDSTITQFSLTIDGQTMRYFHGPRVPQRFEWPNANGLGEVRIEMAPSIGSGTRFEVGPWAWFKILDDMSLQPSGKPETYNLVFDLGDRSATFELVALSAYNPFTKGLLSEFRCPRRISQ